MHVRFADVDENFIKAKVQGGCYTNETELVREAVARGIQAIERGETVALTPDLLQEIKQDAIRKTRNGIPYSSTDAVPENTKLELSVLAKDDLSDIALHTVTQPEPGYTAQSLGDGNLYPRATCLRNQWEANGINLI